jgi:hypothetical protein
MSNRRAIAFIVAFVALAPGWATMANADPPPTPIGYVCQSAWVPKPAALDPAGSLNGMGTYGAVYAYVFSSPSCTGAQIGFAYFCTVGASNKKWCALSSLLTEAQAASLATQLQQAGAVGQKVALYILSDTNAAPPYAQGMYAEFTQP